MNILKYSTLVILANSILSCAAPYNRNFPLLETGMDLVTVTELIGQPISAESGPEDAKILYYRLASSPLDTDGSDTREYFVVMKRNEAIGYGERKDSITTLRDVRQFNAAWNAVNAINASNPNN